MSYWRWRHRSRIDVPLKDVVRPLRDLFESLRDGLAGSETVQLIKGRHDTLRAPPDQHLVSKHRHVSAKTCFRAS